MLWEWIGVDKRAILGKSKTKVHNLHPLTINWGTYLDKTELPTSPSSTETMSSDKSNRSPPSSSIPRPNSLLSKSLPSLLSAPADGTVEVPPRPRALWKVLDTSLRQIPHFYPKLNPNCSIYVSDASPSVIAVRISECLRKRSISAEYDEEVVRMVHNR